MRPINLQITQILQWHPVWACARFVLFNDARFRVYIISISLRKIKVGQIWLAMVSRINGMQLSKIKFRVLCEYIHWRLQEKKKSLIFTAKGKWPPRGKSDSIVRSRRIETHWNVIIIKKNSFIGEINLGEGSSVCLFLKIVKSKNAADNNQWS